MKTRMEEMKTNLEEYHLRINQELIKGISERDADILFRSMLKSNHFINNDQNTKYIITEIIQSINHSFETLKMYAKFRTNLFEEYYLSTKKDILWLEFVELLFTQDFSIFLSCNRIKSTIKLANNKFIKLKKPYTDKYIYDLTRDHHENITHFESLLNGALI